jgi:hypothetical protein
MKMESYNILDTLSQCVIKGTDRQFWQGNPLVNIYLKDQELNGGITGRISLGKFLLRIECEDGGSACLVDSFLSERAEILNSAITVFTLLWLQ